MTTTNVNNWAMRSGIENEIMLFNMGFTTRRAYAKGCYDARAPYVGTLRNFLLYLKDRWF